MVPAARLPARRYQIQAASPYGPYIVDFVPIARKLIIEVDGGQHGGSGDRARTQWLEAQGYRVIRFWNNDVLRDTSAVLEDINCALKRIH